jgi:hypothetical protein
MAHLIVRSGQKSLFRKCFRHMGVPTTVVSQAVYDKDDAPGIWIVPSP